MLHVTHTSLCHLLNLRHINVTCHYSFYSSFHVVEAPCVACLIEEMSMSLACVKSLDPDQFMLSIIIVLLIHFLLNLMIIIIVII